MGRLSRLCAIFVGAAFTFSAVAQNVALQVDSGAEPRLPAEATLLWSRDYGSYRWLQVTGADARRLSEFEPTARIVRDAGVLHIGRHRFDPLLSGAPTGNARLHGDGSGLALIQFQGPLVNAWLDELRLAGIEPLQYYPHHAMLVHASASGLARMASLDAVRWWGPFLDVYKQHDDLDRRSGVIENISVLFHPREPAEAVAARFERDGFKLRGLHPAQPDRRLWEAVVHGSADDLARLASHPEVIWFGYSSPRGYLEDEMASQIVAGNHDGAGEPAVGYQAWLAGIGTGLSGEGVIWSITDSGVDYSHPDFAGRIVGGINHQGCPAGNGPGDDPSTGGHGTHVAGIVAGPATTGLTDADGFLWGLGIAPGARLFAQNPICAGGQPWPPAGGWQVLSRNALLGKAIGSNNSWTSGEGTNIGYNATARTHDVMVRNGNFDSATLEPFFIVFSAGNSGSGAGTLTSPKEAKNPIVVGSSLNFRAGSIDALASSSSRGPTRDGRIAPIVVAPGQQIVSTRRLGTAAQCTSVAPGTSSQYAFCSGTSMAAPQVSGALALITEWWRGLHDGSDPSPAMGKALLVNGAIDITGTPAPNNNQGWGRIHLPDSLGLDALQVHLDQEVLLEESGEVWILNAGVADPAQPLKVTLAWTDPPGPTGIGPALVNNLDLAVVVDGDVYLGNVFSNGVSTQGGSPDTLNNVEKVFLPDPGDSIEIVVRATSLGGDALLGDPPQLRQDFALVCSNCALEPDFTLSVTPRTLALCAPDTAGVDIAVGQILDFEDSVTLGLLDAPAGLTFQFDNSVLTPPASATLSLDDTAAAAPGTYLMSITGDSSTGLKSRGLRLDLFDGLGEAPLLVAPVDGATYQSLTPELSWHASDQAQTYVIQIARDADFADIVSEQTLEATTFSPVAPLDSASNYWWRVRADNACGAGVVSEAFRFQTAPEAGDCLPEDETLVHFSDRFDDGPGSWIVETAVGTAQWSLSNEQPRSPPSSWFAANVSTVSDQRLVSPTFLMPGDAAAPVLVFHQWRDIESGGATGCYDGGVLEVSLANGPFTALPAGQLLTDPYQGTINGGFSNPLAGMAAWCGSFQSYSRVVVDATPWTGQQVRLRFRMGTDSSVSRTGWHIDDLSVQSCGVSSADHVFRNGFE